MIQIFKCIFCFALLFLTVFSCKKDKVQTIPEQKTLLYERITGKYNVYDTNFILLYQMELKYMRNDNTWDSINFTNIDNNFNFASLQSTSTTFDFVDEKFVYVSSPFPTFSKNHKSWTLYSVEDSVYDNVWRNDTIKLCFKKHNTPWWLQEMVPYVSRIEKQIAVKQH